MKRKNGAFISGDNWLNRLTVVMVFSAEVEGRRARNRRKGDDLDGVAAVSIGSSVSAAPHEFGWRRVS